MMDSLKQITNYYHDQFLANLDSVKQFLQEQGPGSAHSFQNVLYIWTGQQFLEVDLSTVNPSLFLNAVSLADAAQDITARLNQYSQLNTIKDYTVQVIGQGELLEFPFQQGLNTFVVSNKRGSNYFDFVLYTPHQRTFQTLTYINRQIQYFNHSGDVGALLHTISYPNLPQETPFILGVVGYGRRFLRLFSDQLPAVLLVNHSTQTLYIVPCPLDQATLNNATFAGLVVGKRVGDKIQYAVLPAPVTQDNVNTGDISTDLNIVLQQALTQAQEMWSRPAEVPHIPTETSQVVPPTCTETVSVRLGQDIPTRWVFQVVEDGLEMKVYAELSLQFGTGLRHVYQYTNQPAPSVPLSFCGVSVGPAALALGTGYSGTIPDNWPAFQALLSHNLPVVHVSTRWIDQVKMCCDTLLNTIFIVHATGTGTVESILDETNINAISAMAGPNALVLVKIGADYYFYRGVRWPNLKTLPPFGTNVNELIETLRYVQTPWPRFHSRKDTSVFWSGQMVNYLEVAEQITSMNLSQVADCAADIEDVLTQLKVLLSSEQLNGVIQQLQTVLTSLMQQHLQSYRDQSYQALVAAEHDVTNKQFQQAMNEYRHQSRLANKILSPLTAVLADTISLRGASTRSHDLKNLARRLKISSNVETAKNMTLNDKLDLLDNECATCGVLISNVNSDYLPQLLSAVSQSRLLDFVQQNCLELMTRDDRAPMLDSITLGALLELSQGKQHLLTGNDQCVAIPRGRNQSSLPLPLYDRHINLKDPSIYWIDECNLPEVAMFRILLRGTICGATSSRTFNISPGSRDLGYFLVHGILTTMESIVSGISRLPTEKDFDDTSCQMMRGLFGQLLTLLASGNKPLCMAWQMVMKNPNLEIPEDNEWWIYRRLVQCFPYTAWPIQKLMCNVKLMLIRTLRKRITDPLTDPLRKESAKIKAEEQKNFVERRNNELKFLRLAIETLFHLRHTSASATEVATRLLEFVPKELSKAGGINRVIHFLQRVQTSASAPAIGGVEDDKFLKVLQIALDIHTKRSACFQDIKGRFLGALTGDNELQRQEILDELTQVKQELLARADAEVVRIQNETALIDGDLNKVKSDGELNRTPWSITPEAKDDTDHYANLKYILGDSSDTCTTVVTAVEVAPESALVQMFKAHAAAGTNRVLSFVESLPELQVAQLKVPQVDFIELMAIAGFNESTVRTILEILLTHWNDVLAGEQAAISSV